MRRLLTLLFSLVLMLAGVQQAQAQSEVEVIDQGVSYFYGEEIDFSAHIQSTSPIQEADLYFAAEGDQNPHVFPLGLEGDNLLQYSYELTDNPLRAFASVSYWYHLVLDDGGTFDSPHYSFRYDDNRYPWQTLQDSDVRLHWYAGDEAFGQTAFGIARAGYQGIRSLFAVDESEPVDIYVYASTNDVQEALSLGASAWIAGHASPDLGVVLLSISPGDTQDIEMERQIPHEMARVLLYRLTSPAYANLPTWLSEGLASQAELYPNANYAQVLTLAEQNDSLLDITDLCGPFPADASGATLAYAESDSFVRYLQSTYGSSGVQALIQAYTDGLACDPSAARALGSSLSQLDLQWQQNVLGSDASGQTLANLLPYLVLFGIVLIIPVWRLGLNWKEKRQDARSKR